MYGTWGRVNQRASSSSSLQGSGTWPGKAYTQAASLTVISSFETSLIVPNLPYLCSAVHEIIVQYILYLPYSHYSVLSFYLLVSPRQDGMPGNQSCWSGSAWIRNFCLDPELLLQIQLNMKEQISKNVISLWILDSVFCRIVVWNRKWQICDRFFYMIELKVVLFTISKYT